MLSGGGATGLAHIGVLKALEEENIPIDFLTGTSAGALVGGLYCAGYTPEEIEALVKSEKFLLMSQGLIESKYQYYFKKNDADADMVMLRLSKDSILQTSIPTNLVTPALMDWEMMSGFSAAAAAAGYDFDSLFIPFRCVASDIHDKKSIIFRSGQLHEAVRASMTFPFYLKPIRVNGKLLFDGGLYNNFPSNVMYDAFLPDVIIGSNVSGNTAPPDEDNVMSQIKNMIVTHQDYGLRCDNGIILNPKTTISTFDFQSADEAIQAGYTETKKQIDSIKLLIHRRITKEERAAKRAAFKAKCPPVVFDKIEVEGINSKQQHFVRRTLVKKKEETVSLEELKPRYFRVSNDERIGFMYPKTYYNPKTGKYMLRLDIKKDKEFKVEFGGNFSSRPISTGYVGIHYHLLNKHAWTFSGSSYFGKFYAAAHASIRWEPPTKRPFYLEPEFTIHRWDYFRSSSTFFEDVKPSYLIQQENFAGLNFGLPIANRGKLVTYGRYAELADNYYQTENFLSIDTADRTRLFAYTAGVYYERNTLNKKVYANEGSFFFIGAQFVNGEEWTIPGSTAIERDTIKKFHNWGILKMELQTYFLDRGFLRFGFNLETVYSIQPFLQNYTATILSAPVYQPIQESRTLFLDDFRAFQFVGTGLQSIFHFNRNLDLRFEGYMFQPISTVLADADNLPYYSSPLLHRRFIVSGNLVFHSPIGPASIALNYYPEQKQPLSLIFNFGYILFKRKALK